MMRIVKKSENQEAFRWMERCVLAARKASCFRAKCGSIIVKDGEVIGEGYNSPSGESEHQRRCSVGKEMYDKRITDKTCCVHAEQRAIMDALRKNPEKLSGARLYFMRLDGNGNASKAGKPYCTICSKMTIDVGIAEFVLWHEEGICVYEAGEYNMLSYEYKE